MLLSTADRIGLDLLQSIGVDYDELCEFHHTHYEHTNIYAVDGLEDSNLWGWVNSVELSELNQLDAHEAAIAYAPLEQWQEQCMGYSKGYTDINAAYRYDSEGKVVQHDVGDTYSFTMEERNQQYADISGLSNMPIHIENLFNAA